MTHHSIQDVYNELEKALPNTYTFETIVYFWNHSLQMVNSFTLQLIFLYEN